MRAEGGVVCAGSPAPPPPLRGGRDDGATRLDGAALEDLYVRLEKRLYNVVYRWVWAPDVAMDIVQESFLRLWQMRARVDMATVEPLVFRIGVNLAANHRRRAWWRRWLSLEDAEEPASASRGADALLAEAQRARAVRDALEALPEGHRRVLLLCELSGMSYAEISSVLGIPPGTVASRRNTAVRRLRRRLAGEEMKL
ncbi:MAG: sigma-70 family RNA polymerase sigma factor [Candidatus Schekmanbacteria bacterium]|nr:sigma-70 family RNA polymerase sigma factor [Candidatus Schekmanbacteria bacterium]